MYKLHAFQPLFIANVALQESYSVNFQNAKIHWFSTNPDSAPAFCSVHNDKFTC